MSHYLVAVTEIHNMAAMRPYIERVEPLFEKFGGKFVVKSALVDTLEGSLSISSAVVVQFESEEAIRRWYSSPEYEELKSLRRNHSNAKLWITSSI